MLFARHPPFKIHEAVLALEIILGSPDLTGSLMRADSSGSSAATANPYKAKPGQSFPTGIAMIVVPVTGT